jgi:hypothetical protein
MCGRKRLKNEDFDGVPERSGRTKRRAEKERVTAAKEGEKPDAAAVDGEAGVVEMDGGRKCR